MAFNVKKRGKLTYYFRGEAPVFSHLVTEELPDGDLKVYFAGLTGGHSATRALGLSETAFMDPAQEIPLVFASWSAWLREAQICESVARLGFHRDACVRLPAEITQSAGGSGGVRSRSGAAAQSVCAGLWRIFPCNACPITVCPPGSPCMWWTFRTQRPHTNSIRPRFISGGQARRERMELMSVMLEENTRRAIRRAFAAGEVQAALVPLASTPSNIMNTWP